MPNTARIEFRGVCLFVPRPSEGLVRVLMPLTDANSSPMNKHHAYLTIYNEANGSQIGSPVPLAGQALRITSRTGLQVRTLPGLIDVKSLVNQSGVSVIAPQPGRNVEALITVEGGAQWLTKTDSVAGWVREDTKHFIGKPRLEAVWEETEGVPAQIELGAGLTVPLQPGQTGVIGYYDDPQHATQRSIRERTPIWDSNNGANDDDFAWLYTLLTPRPAVQPLPRTYRPAAKNLPSTLSSALLNMTPLTTTCFGGTWEPEE
ncbi:MAG: hypothetical protein ABR551_02835 [Gemmatimonadales bacterium]